jgi:uncharacterized protein YfaS (alpha-2-macroglobulin family)
MRRSRLAVAALAVALLVVGIALGDKPVPPDRAQCEKLQKDGNFKEAYEGFRALSLDPADDPLKVGSDLSNGVACLQQLGRQAEMDAYIEAVIKAHAKNWRLLAEAARQYLNIEHRGAIVAGEFTRGRQRGQAKMVNSYERDRVRALQLLVEAMKLVPEESDKGAVGAFFMSTADTLLGDRSYNGAWRLQYLTDLTKLPDYEDGYYSRFEMYRWGRSEAVGAPVDADGKPVYYALPKNWDAAANDGERWRYALMQAAEYQSGLMDEARWQFANFLRNQFGVQTMADYGWFFGRGGEADETKKDESGTWALHTLGEDETIARLANGIKRFKLPDEYNYVKIYRQLAESGQSRKDDAKKVLGQEFENRRQYPKAADLWRQVGETPRVTQIIGNWGRFEPIMTQPAGQGATVDFRFRNGKKVTFTAHAIKAKDVLDDVKAYINTKPKELNWEQMDISNFGYRLVTKNQAKYLGDKAAEWSLDLEPRANHFDRRVTVTTPLQKAGAYLLKAEMEGGNTSYIVLWVADLSIVSKPMDKQPWFFVADAANGQPVAKANMEFFGYWQEYKENRDANGRWRQGTYVIHTKNFAEFTDADGQCMPTTEQMPQNYQWLSIATTEDGRMAYHGFSGAWYDRRYDPEYNQVKVLLVTDRPVYRPKQKVKFKFWINRARYDAEGKSDFAGQTFTVQINDPKGEKVLEKPFTADEYGGLDGEYELPDECPLGMYYASVVNHGGGQFRVEEYKKPEFEVKVEAPEEPVMLGEKVTAKVAAKYYFGAPVTEAKVKYKVLRTSYSANWYPIARWDWFYGRGYWWFACDYPWYPGWYEWGCKRPAPWWFWDWRPREQPEVVAQGETEVDKDGFVKIDIDTSVAKVIHPDQDHKYEITAEVTDASRRTITGSGQVLVARKPFKVYAWTDCGYHRMGDVIEAQFFAQTLDSKPVQGKGELKLLKVSYKDGKPVETEVQKWDLDTNPEGVARQQIKAATHGQYRLSYSVTDAKKHTIEGGYVFVIRGEGFSGTDFRFNDIEVIPDLKEYAPGDKVKLMLNTNRPESCVLLFTRPTNGVYQKPQVLRLKGKSTVEEIAVVKRDMPNFFVEALTVSGGKVYTEMREIAVPPENKALQVTVEPSAEKYKPGQKATVKLTVKDMTGEPVVGSAVVSIYDKSVEYISGGSNVPEIKEFFWKWRRHHQPQTGSSLERGSQNLYVPKAEWMHDLGVFGGSVADETVLTDGDAAAGNKGEAGYGVGGPGRARGAAMDAAAPAAPMEVAKSAAAGELRDGEQKRKADKNLGVAEEQSGGGSPTGEPTVRTQFADTAFWAASIITNKNGQAEVELTMPENLTTWKTRVWTMGSGARCGEGTVDVVTTKNLIIRLQAPRFFVQKDEVVLSANVHNYLATAKKVRVVLETDEPSGSISPVDAKPQRAAAESRPSKLPGWELFKEIEVPAGGEKRVDWRVRVDQPGDIVIRMKAITDEESDAMAMTFPVFVHGMLKTESFCGVIRPDKTAAELALTVPAERRPAESRLEIRYSPTLAAAMVDALPYMAEYPYGCTEQSLNRFLPTVVTQKVLMKMGLDLKAIGEKRTNLNAQEIGDDVERAKQWKRFDRNPVFDQAELTKMVKAGVEKLTSMQCADGGWGWFSGWGEQSWPHTTAVVVHGLQLAQANDVAVVPGMLDRGVAWLKNYQAEQIRMLKNAPTQTRPWKDHADNLDAFVYMVLVDAKTDNVEMREFLYRDRNELAVYAKAMFALALHKTGQAEQRDMLRRNIEQFLVQDDENQTAYLKLPENNWWWCWYGSEIEADAYYLKLLTQVDPKSEVSSRMVKYLLNNRKHATYWNSTRDTAVVIEAFADYMKASGEDKPDLTIEILVDGKLEKKVQVNAENLFTFDNKLVIEGEKVTTGKHKVEFKKSGTGPLYWNAYLTNFTLEDPITKAGLEIKVERKFYQLVAVDKTVKDRGSRGQAVDKKVEKYERKPLENLATLKSGDLVEIELEIESKNDYEYILFEDMKAAGFEPVEVRSGYNGNDMGAYVEFRDERVVFFVRWLGRGKHSVSYRLRAEIPGLFSALPAKASAMYAPELKANSDEIKMKITD